MTEPGPSTVLAEAEAAAEAGRYEEALAKHVWYHENALRLEPSQFGVRLSFALMAWYRLGKHYAPALDRLRKIRDESVSRLREDETDSDLFADVVALNDLFEEPEKTVEIFRWLDEHRPDSTRIAYIHAWPVLAAQGQYALCCKYMDIPGDFQAAESCFETTNRLADQWRDAGKVAYADDLRDTVRNHYMNQVCTLVALLVQNGPPQEAEEYALRCRDYLHDAELDARMAGAIHGQVPVRWPPPIGCALLDAESE